MEASAGEVGLGKAEGRGGQGGSRKVTREMREEKANEEKNGGGEKGSGRMGNLG